jgi:hypothetical protein
VWIFAGVAGLVLVVAAVAFGLNWNNQKPADSGAPGDPVVVAIPTPKTDAAKGNGLAEPARIDPKPETKEPETKLSNDSTPSCTSVPRTRSDLFSPAHQPSESRWNAARSIN